MSRRIRRTLGLLAPAVLLLTSAVATPAAQGAAFCPSMQVVGVRGSGETADDAGGFGSTVRAVVDRIHGVNPTAVATPIDYPAVPVEWWKPSYPSDYAQSVLDGAEALTSFIVTHILTDCGTTTYLYLVGYSQGAHVVGHAYAALDPLLKQRVAGVALIADPVFSGKEGAPVTVGTAKNKNGILTFALPPRSIPTAQEPFVRSYCMAEDVVCQSSAANTKKCAFGQSSCPHLHYADTVLPKTDLTYTDLAGNYLLAQWRRFGPEPPSIGPRTSILIFDGYGDGVANLTAALTPMGFSVTYAASLPMDLSTFGQIWWYGIRTLTPDEEDRLIAYARAGGSVFLTGEWQSCGCNNTNVANVFDSLVVTVGGLTFGPDLATGTDVSQANPDAIDGTAKLPNTLTTYSSNAIGTISPINIGGEHFVFVDGSGNGTMGVWDTSDVFGGGRLVINMDVNWAETTHGDMATMPRIAQNIGYFLSGATSSQDLAAVMGPAGRRRSVPSATAGFTTVSGR